MIDRPRKTQIVLLKNLPVSKRHGKKKGRILEAVNNTEKRRGDPHWFVDGDAGVKVGVLHHEAKPIQPQESEAKG